MLSKKQQTYSNRLKPKAKKEPKYLSWLHQIEQPPCFVCNTIAGIQMHHVKEHSTDARIDSQIIPLCQNHHLGNDFSVHMTPKAFKETYDMKTQLKYADDLYRRYNEN